MIYLFFLNFILKPSSLKIIRMSTQINKWSTRKVLGFLLNEKREEN